MPGGHDPRDPVERVGRVVIIALSDRRTDMDAHPHAEGLAGLPGLRGERALGGQRRRYRVRRQREGGLERVADGLEGMATCAGGGA